MKAWHFVLGSRCGNLPTVIHMVSISHSIDQTWQTFPKENKKSVDLSTREFL